MNVLLQLRVRAMDEPDYNKRRYMHALADSIQNSARNFERSPSDEALTELTGSWVRGHRVLAGLIDNEPTGGMSGGLKDGALLQEAA